METNEKLFSEAMHQYSNVRFEKAANMLAELAKKEGHAGAQYVRGAILNNGTGIHTNYLGMKTNHEEAAQLLQMAAAQGHPGALFEMGRRYETGHGVKKDMALAVSSYEQAALQGHVIAQLWLGFICQEGTGVEADSRKARFWWEQAARQGNVVAACAQVGFNTQGRVPYNPFGMPVVNVCKTEADFIDYGNHWTYNGPTENSLPEGEGIWKEEYETSGPYDTEITHTTTYRGQFHHGLLHGYVTYNGPSGWFAQFPKEYSGSSKCLWRAGSFVGIEK